MSKALERTRRATGAAALAAGVVGLGYVTTTWYRYGRPDRPVPNDPMLDRFMPEYEVAERHETRVRAPAPGTWDAARALDLKRSPVIRAIFAGRELAMRSARNQPTKPAKFLEEVLQLGWRILAEEPGRELILGAVTKPWEPNVRFRRLEPEAFAAFQEPGYAKIAWTLVVEPRDADTSLFRTETRVVTTDPESRARFRRYWSVFSPGIKVIRWETLRLVRRAAEQQTDLHA
jgi:hypothetical protein